MFIAGEEVQSSGLFFEYLLVLMGSGEENQQQPKNQHTALVITSPRAREEQNSELHREDEGCRERLNFMLPDIFI